MKKAEGKREKKQFHRDHSLLDKQAFEGLCQSVQQISWNAKELRDEVTDDLYDEYVRIGILVEEDVYNCEAIEYHTESRFYHKLFLEWYAAHHLAKEAAKPNTEFEPWPKRIFEPWPQRVFESLPCKRNQAVCRLGYRAAATVRANFLQCLNPTDLHFMY